jgi:hypothetical protein
MRVRIRRSQALPYGESERELKRDREAESSRGPMRTGGRIRRSRAQALTANGDVDDEMLPDSRPQSSASMKTYDVAGAKKIRVNIDEARRPKAARAYAHGRANTMLAGVRASPRRWMAVEKQTHWDTRLFAIASA